MSIDPFPYDSKPDAKARTAWRVCGWVVAVLFVFALDAALVHRAAAILA